MPVERSTPTDKSFASAVGIATALPTPPADRLPVDVDRRDQVASIDYVELYVSNHVHAAHFYQSVLGFAPIGIISDGQSPDRLSVALQRGNARLLLTAPATSSSPVARHIHRHGESIADVALAVGDADTVFDRAIRCGGRAVSSPHCIRSPSGVFCRATLATTSGVMHTLVQRSGPNVPFWPGLTASGPVALADTAIDGFDHIGLALSPAALASATEFYASALHLETVPGGSSDDEDRDEGRVVGTMDGRVRLRLCARQDAARERPPAGFASKAPAPTQCLAFRSHNIIKSVYRTRHALEFAAAPPEYYSALEQRVGNLSWELGALRLHGIRVDATAAGLRFHLVSTAIGARPTLSVALIERRPHRPT